MAVKVFQGNPPEYPYEKKVVWHLEEALSSLDQEFVLISNFHVRASGNPTASQVDLVIIGRDRILLVELKSVSDAAGKPLPVSGGSNGRWRKGQDPIPGSNPFQQTMAAYWNLSQWL